MSNYTPIIGMEVHVELRTDSKMFCACKNDPFNAAKPNTYTCPVCLGLPGALPLPNKKAVDWTIKLGLALRCRIAQFSKFDRKHYFYPDLPKGYQISQYDIPLCENGNVTTANGAVGIRRVHLEEDTGKLLHTTVEGEKVTLIDFNRSGVPLVEIVTEPDIRSSLQAKEYAKKIKEIVKTLQISDADMEKGSMRLEANISLSRDPAVLPDYKVEVKNINSFRFLEQAIDYELNRQAELLDQGTIPTQETRGWNEEKRQTVPQRTKESAEDYRYFPDPDLPPMTFTQDQINELEGQLPELPEAQEERYLKLGIKAEYARLLSSDIYPTVVIDQIFEAAKGAGVDVSLVAGAIVNKKVPYREKTPAEVVEAVNSLYSHEEVSISVVEEAVRSVIAEQGKAVADYKQGKTQVMGFLIGEVLRRLGKKVQPSIVAGELQRQLI